MKTVTYFDATIAHLGKGRLIITIPTALHAQVEGILGKQVRVEIKTRE
jgi:hypothetical protein